jgi:hypothetical protein
LITEHLYHIYFNDSTMSSLICDAGSCVFTRVDTDSNQTIAPWTDPVNQDAISPGIVAITRDYQGIIFNALEGDPNDWMGPFGTEWDLLPYGKTFEEARCKMRFCNWMDCFAQYDTSNIEGKKGIVHLIEEDLYYNIEFLSWTDDFGSTLGGGFSYRRDENPIALPEDLPLCPDCSLASANPRILTGPLDNTFVDVSVTGVTPADSTITIKAVAQDQHQGCASLKVIGTDRVYPNARNVGGETVRLRRTRVKGSLYPLQYTIYFDATAEGGTCSGSVNVCVPPEGFEDCDLWLGYDATSTEVCYN